MLRYCISVLLTLNSDLQRRRRSRATAQGNALGLDKIGPNQNTEGVRKTQNQFANSFRVHIQHRYPQTQGGDPGLKLANAFGVSHFKFSSNRERQLSGGLARKALSPPASVLSRRGASLN